MCGSTGWVTEERKTGYRMILQQLNVLARGKQDLKRPLRIMQNMSLDVERSSIKKLHIITVNRKLSTMNKLLMEENDHLQKQVSQLVYENGYMRQQWYTPSAVTDASCQSVVTTPQLDSSRLHPTLWQSSFQRLQELLLIGSRCLG